MWYFFVIYFWLATTARAEEAMQCNKEEQCTDINNTCKCYCSRVCGYRKKILTGPDKDAPIYIPNDPNKKYCYCKQRDLDTFEKNKCPLKEAAKRRDRSRREKFMQ